MLSRAIRQVVLISRRKKGDNIRRGNGLICNDKDNSTRSTRWRLSFQQLFNRQWTGW